MQFHFIYIGLDLLHFCIKVLMLNEVKLRFLYHEERSCAERSEAYGFNAEQSEARF